MGRLYRDFLDRAAGRARLGPCPARTNSPVASSSSLASRLRISPYGTWTPAELRSRTSSVVNITVGGSPTSAHVGAACTRSSMTSAEASSASPSSWPPRPRRSRQRPVNYRAPRRTRWRDPSSGLVPLAHCDSGRPTFASSDDEPVVPHPAGGLAIETVPIPPRSRHALRAECGHARKR